MTSLDYEVSLLRLLEKVTNGTVIEISLTGMLYFFSVDAYLTKFRYRCPRQTWNHLRRTTRPRMPSFTINRVFSGANNYACSIFEKATCVDPKRYYHG